MAITYFTDYLFGNDNVGGSSEGSPKASGIDAIITSGDKTIDLSGDSPDLSMAVSGDTIRISGYTDGIRSGEIFEIMSVNDGVDTVDVVQIPTSSISGLTWAIGGAFKTIGKSIDVIEPGDTLFIKNSDNYAEKIVQTIKGTTVSPIHIEGYSSVPGDKGVAVVDGTFAGAGNGWTGPAGNIYTVYENIRITKFTGDGYKSNTGNQADFIKCRFDNNGDNAIQVRANNTFLDCYIHNNANVGVVFSQFDNYLIGCVVQNNGGHGIQLGGRRCILYGCLIVGNTGDGVYSSFNDQTTVINCTVDGKNQTTNAGFNFIQAGIGRVVFINNIIVGCVSGVVSVTDHLQETVSLNNLLFNNIVNYEKFNTHFGEVLKDPLFVDPDNMDYSLSDSSPALQSGFDLAMNPWISTKGGHINIGALQKVKG